MFSFRKLLIFVASIASLVGIVAWDILSVHAVTPSWTTNTSVGADYTYPIVKYNSTRSEFAVAYSTVAGTHLRFSTSSVGTAWSSPVTITSGLLTALPLLTVNSSGAYFTGTFSSTAGIFGTSANSGLSWTTSTPTGFDRHYNSASLSTVGSSIYLGGSVGGSGISGFWSAYSVNGGSSFTSSTLAGQASQGRSVAGGNQVVGVYTISGDATNLYVLSSTSGSSYEKTTIAMADSGGITSPFIAIDSNNRTWIAYYVNVGGSYFIEIATFNTGDSGSCIWKRERIDTAGTTAPSSLDLAFLNGSTPIISYSYKADGVRDLRYAVRDNGSSGCSGSDGSKWSCANIVTTLSGNDPVSLATNGAGKTVVAYQNPGMYAASADFLGTSYDYSCTASTSSSNSYALQTLLSPIFISADSIVINKGVSHTASRQVDVVFNVKNASEVAISLNSGMFGAVWGPYIKSQSITLPNSTGQHKVYAKFTNQTGAVSEIASSTIVYEPVIIITPPPVPSVTFPIILVPSAPPIPLVVVPLPHPPFFGIQDIGTEPSFDHTETMAKLIIQQKKMKEEGFLCPERPTAFSVGASVVRDRSTGKRYVMLTSQGVICPVLSNAVLASWGIRSVTIVANIAGMRVSSALPYRPGTIVRVRETGHTYFANPQGRLHRFASPKILSTLGYRASFTRVDSRAVVSAFTEAVTLSRTDIHPDGTLFVIDERAGLFAILHKRIIHHINRKTLDMYGENRARAVRFRAGEKYEIGDSWNLR